MKRKEPIRLQKKEERKPLKIVDSNNMIAGIPIEFVLITVIMICFFGLILLFMGPCTESGMWFNAPHI